MRCTALMRRFALCAPLMLTACATMGPPLPPSLNLPQPPSDLKASRKGDRVALTWSLPATTTDRQTIRSLGPTSICRSVAELKDCGTPVGQIAAQAALPTVEASGHKPEGSYTDVIPGTI